MENIEERTFSGAIMEDEMELSLGELSSACRVHAEYLIELVQEGIIDPVNMDNASWVFKGHCLKRVRTAINLQRDLGVNLPGVALALNLMQEMDELRAELDRTARRIH